MSLRSTLAAASNLSWGALGSIVALGGIVTLGGIAALSPAACAHGAGTSPGFSPLAFDASALDDGGDDAGVVGPMPKAYVRFADWAPDGLPGFDICVVPHGSSLDAGTWLPGMGAMTMGPLLGKLVAFPNVSPYVPIPVGTYDVTVLSQGAKTCSQSAVTPIPLPALADGSRATVAIIGDLAPIGTDSPAQGIALADDAVGPQGGKAAVRFVDAMPSASNVVFGIGAVVSATFQPLTAAVASGGLPAGPAMNGSPADANGYILLDPLRGGSLSAQSLSNQSGAFVGSSTTFSFDGGFPAAGQPTVYAGTNDVATGSNASWGAGNVVTVALIDGNWGTTPQIQLCVDNAGPAGWPASCTVLSP
jgi:hypothetical protein